MTNAVPEPVDADTVSPQSVVDNMAQSLGRLHVDVAVLSARVEALQAENDALRARLGKASDDKTEPELPDIDASGRQRKAS